jgi:hypothetical protein
MNENTGYPQIDDFSFHSWFREFQKGHLPISEEMQKLAFEFSMLWNSFESEVFDQEIDANKVASNVKICVEMECFEERDFESHWEFVLRKFASMDEVNLRNFLLSKKKIKHPSELELVGRLKNYIAADEVDLSSRIFTMVIIVWKMRDNFFHGPKEMTYLNNQYDLFKFAISFMANYLLRTCRPEEKRDAIKKLAKSKRRKNATLPDEIRPVSQQGTKVEPVIDSGRNWITPEEYPRLTQAEIDHHNENETRPFKLSQKA